jgi:hypothetical protein
METSPPSYDSPHGTSAAQAEAGEGWVCNTCTFINHFGNASGDATCEMCCSPKDAPQTSEGLHLPDEGGAIVTCDQHNHPLKHVTSGNAWFCNVCAASKSGDDHRKRCGVCPDFDICAECAKGKDVHEHPLKWVSCMSGGRWFCNKCKICHSYAEAEGVSTSIARRYRCHTCDDFDLCGWCTAGIAPPGSKQAGDEKVDGEKLDERKEAAPCPPCRDDPSPAAAAEEPLLVAGGSSSESSLHFRGQIFVKVRRGL